MKTKTSYALLLTLLFGVTACGGPDAGEGRKVEASGKETTALDAVPTEVLAVAMASKPELMVSQAEYETRDGNEYYDVGGTLPDGSELELDMTRVDGVWTVVEIQRDIGMDTLPENVSNTLGSKFPAWKPERIIESDQGDGVIVYEFFGEDDSGEAIKIEIMWADGQAELLVDEWAH